MAQTSARKPDETPEAAATTPAKARVLADTPEAHTDHVAAVSRDKNGNPDQAQGYELIVPDKDKPAAENKPSDNQA